MKATWRSTSSVSPDSSPAPIGNRARICCAGARIWVHLSSFGARVSREPFLSRKGTFNHFTEMKMTRTQGEITMDALRHMVDDKQAQPTGAEQRLHDHTIQLPPVPTP